MAQRTKQQKKLAEARRKDSFVFTEHGVSLVTDLTRSKAPEKSGTFVVPELQTRVKKDLVRSVSISLCMFVLLFGIYFYLR